LIPDLRVVGFGASAGGIEALRGFFQNMPAHNDLAFVVMLHLSPDRTSMLAEVLGRWTGMPVEQVTDRIAVVAEHVYVIAPNALMTIEAGRLHLRAPTKPMRPDVSRVLDTLDPFERRVARHDGSAHYQMRILPYRAAHDRVDGALVTFVDVTSMVQAEQHQRMMVDELNHRVRNMLTVVISLASQTLRQSKLLPEFSEASMGRVNALAAAYTLLGRDNWTEVPLRDPLQEELRPFTAQARNNVSVSGTRLLLKPRGALALGMAVHELVTNAVKYGALSLPDGKVAIYWDIAQVDGAEQFVWHWDEQCGPPMKPPDRRGIGLSMIERSLRHELKGDAEFAFEPEGLRGTLTMPLDPALVSRADAREARS
jgi:two-component sensor histidine kinase